MKKVDPNWSLELIMTLARRSAPTTVQFAPEQVFSLNRFHCPVSPEYAVYVHPFQDGNGRVHRFLIHHVLAEREYTPPGMLFLVSSVMQDRIDDYHRTLQAHSMPLMDFIE